MVLSNRLADNDDESMPQIVPSAGFTPPCDYSTFADNFDLSLLPPLSPDLYYSSPPPPNIPKICTFAVDDTPADFETPDFQNFMQQPNQEKFDNLLHLEVPCSSNYYANSPTGALYSPQLLSPNTLYSPPEYTQSSYQYSDIKKEPFNGMGILESSPEEAIKEEQLSDNTPDFQSLGFDFKDDVKEKPQQDHQLLREVLRDTSFQKKYNIKSLDFPILSPQQHLVPEIRQFPGVKMEEDQEEYDEFVPGEDIEPVLNLAIEQMRKDVDKTCSALSISADPSQWSQSNVFAWLEWTSKEFNIPAPLPEQWDIDGASLMCMNEEDFLRRSPQGGAILHAQLEIWKAAFLDDEILWHPSATETTSNASSGDISDNEDEEMPVSTASSTSSPSDAKRSNSTGSHIHLWQFLKELLASPQAHGSCIRWLDRGKGVFKIEDSVKVARLWGKRKNRPAMNYDKLSRSIRQYYKKGIMKKTERSQRLVYQFCHPYCL